MNYKLSSTKRIEIKIHNWAPCADLQSVGDLLVGVDLIVVEHGEIFLVFGLNDGGGKGRWSFLEALPKEQRIAVIEANRQQGVRPIPHICVEKKGARSKTKNKAATQCQAPSRSKSSKKVCANRPT